MKAESKDVEQQCTTEVSFLLCNSCHKGSHMCGLKSKLWEAQKHQLLCPRSLDVLGCDGQVLEEHRSLLHVGCGSSVVIGSDSQQKILLKRAVCLGTQPAHINVCPPSILWMYHWAKTTPSLSQNKTFTKLTYPAHLMHTDALGELLFYFEKQSYNPWNWFYDPSIGCYSWWGKPLPCKVERPQSRVCFLALWWLFF